MLLWDCDEASGSEDCSDEQMNKNWFKKIYSFTKISDTLLLGWISGKEAEWMENISSDVVAEKCTEILRTFLKDPYVPRPTRCVCTSWKKQLFSRGECRQILI
jgi:spermine oxidase